MLVEILFDVFIARVVRLTGLNNKVSLEVDEELLLPGENTFKSNFRVVHTLEEIYDVQFFAQLLLSFLQESILLPVSFAINALFASRKRFYPTDDISPRYSKSVHLKHHIDNFQYLTPFQRLSRLQVFL